MRVLFKNSVHRGMAAAVLVYTYQRHWFCSAAKMKLCLSSEQTRQLSVQTCGLAVE